MRLIARTLVALRFLVVPAWIAAAVWVAIALPPVDEAASGDLGALLPTESAALRAEEASARAFAVPVRGRAVLVEHAPGGLGAERQRAIAERALAVAPDGGRRVEGLAGAIPVTDALLLGRPPGEARTALTTLVIAPTGIASQWRAAQDAGGLAGRPRGSPADAREGPARLTGVVPARIAEGDVILGRLHWVEIATALVVALLVGLHFRAVGAPLLALATVAVAYLVSSRLVGWAGQRLDVTVPSEVQPVLVVLVFGVTTDYVLFLLDGFRARLCEGESPARAAADALARLGAPIAAAGLAVVGATGVLAVAELELLRGFGPGMALAVLVSLVVALTFVPCAAALLGRLVLWPRDPAGIVERPPRGWGAKLATRAPMLVVVPCFALLVACAAGLGRLDLGEPLVAGLPAASEPRQAEAAADATLPAGVTSPTEVLLRGSGVGRDGEGLRALGEALRGQPGAGLVIAPDAIPAGWPGELLRRDDGTAARFLVAWETPALGAAAIDDLRALRDRLPGLVREAGLQDADAVVAGDTALTAATIDRAIDDLLRVAPLAVLAVVLVLVLLLRAVLAPLYLVAAGLLALAAALGAATWVFVVWLGQDGLSWLVPVAACVLLLSLGADYTVFLAGRIWGRAARGGRLRAAVAEEAADASRPIRAAAIVLAASFALLALVPLRTFEQIAFTVVVGLLLDAFVVRSLLVPALVVLLGPGRRLRARAARAGGAVGT